MPLCICSSLASLADDTKAMIGTFGLKRLILTLMDMADNEGAWPDISEGPVTTIHLASTFLDFSTTPLPVPISGPSYNIPPSRALPLYARMAGEELVVLEDDRNRSASITILRIVETLATGYLPLADSPARERTMNQCFLAWFHYQTKQFFLKRLDLANTCIPESITQSAPSNIALATSVHSALVGRGFFCMLSNI